MKKAFIYVRVSTQEQTNGYSIDQQKERLLKYCDAMNWSVANIFIDGGYSGSNMNRPALQQMLKDIKKCNIVVVYKLDRLSRSQKDTLNIIENYFLANNIDFVSMTENFDTSTPYGKAMIGILSVFAQLEREQIKERMSLGRVGRAKNGKWRGGGYLPIGYDYVGNELVINEFEALQVKEAFDLILSGESSHGIERIFNEKGYTHKYGKWTRDRVSKMLKNILYVGYTKFNKETYKGNHTPLISEDDFNKVQEILNSRKGTVALTKKSTYLGGLLFCKKCGARYCVTTSKNKRYYSCHSRRKQNHSMVKDPNCKNKIYRLEVLDNIVFNELRMLKVDSKHSNKTSKNDKKEIISKEINKINNQRSRLIDLYSLGQFTIEELQNKIRPLDDKILALNNELVLSQESKKNNILINSIGDILDNGTYEDIRFAIITLINRIEIDDDNVHIIWNI